MGRLGNIFLGVTLFCMVAGCAPLTRGTVALSGGGTGGSNCDYEGLFRGSECIEAVTHIYFSDKDYGNRIPRVCGSITTWGAFGSKNWRPGESCYPDAVSFCKSDVLIPGFDNQTAVENNVDTMALLNKKRLCAELKRATVVIYANGQIHKKDTRVWARLYGRDELAKRVDIENKGDDPVTYCKSSVLFPGLDDQVLVDYGVLQEAIQDKGKFCKQLK